MNQATVFDIASPLKDKLKVDVGIITIRPDEFETVLFHFKSNENVNGNRQQYHLSSIKKNGFISHRIAIIRCSKHEGSDVKTATRDLIKELSPKWLLIVGVAAGRPVPDFMPGDVLVSADVHTFNVDTVLKSLDREYNFEKRPSASQTTSVATNLPTLKNINGWYSPKSLGVERPYLVVTDDQLEGPDDWRRTIKNWLPNQAAKIRPQVVVGTIASSNRLIRHPEQFPIWMKMARYIHAVEMESADIYHAAHDSNIPCIAIRGINSIIGLKPTEQWTRYACNSAVSFAREFISTLTISSANNLPATKPLVNKSIEITFSLKIPGEYNEAARKLVEDLVGEMKDKILDGRSLTIVEIRPGSIEICLASSRESYEKIKALFENGELQSVLGVEVLDVREQPEEPDVATIDAPVVNEANVARSVPNTKRWHSSSIAKMIMGVAALLALALAIIRPEMSTKSVNPSIIVNNRVALKNKVDNIEIYLDISQHMNGDIGGVQKLPAITGALKRVFESELFDKNDQPYLAFRVSGRNCDSHRALDFSQENKEPLLRLLPQLKAKGKSNISRAIDDARADFSGTHFKKEGPKSIIALVGGGGGNECDVPSNNRDDIGLGLDFGFVDGNRYFGQEANRRRVTNYLVASNLFLAITMPSYIDMTHDDTLTPHIDFLGIGLDRQAQKSLGILAKRYGSTPAFADNPDGIATELTKIITANRSKDGEPMKGSTNPISSSIDNNANGAKKSVIGKSNGVANTHGMKMDVSNTGAREANGVNPFAPNAKATISTTSKPDSHEIDACKAEAFNVDKILDQAEHELGQINNYMKDYIDDINSSYDEKIKYSNDGNAALSKALSYLGEFATFNDLCDKRIGQGELYEFARLIREDREMLSKLAYLAQTMLRSLDENDNYKKAQLEYEQIIKSYKRAERDQLREQIEHHGQP